MSILSELIDNEILMQRAEKLGLLATDEEVNAKLTEIKAPFTQEEFDKRLKERSITLDDFKRDLRRSITIDKVLNKEITSKINVYRRRHHQLLQPAQGRVQPHRAAVSPGADPGHHPAEPAGEET